MLSDILKHRDKLVKIKTIDDILINSLFDSELEKKFIEALGRIGNIEKQMVDMDLDYIQNKRGFWYDIGLLFRTIPVFLGKKGAH